MKTKATQNKELIKKLASYTASAGALLALAPVARGQIVYSGEQNLEFGPTGDPEYIDLDDDGMDDFLFYLSFSSTQFTSGNYYVSMVEAIGIFANANTAYMNSWLGTYNPSISTLFPAALGSDSAVDESASTWINNYYGFGAAILEYLEYIYVAGPTSTYTAYYDYGYFRGGTNYLGFRFYIGSNIHYGWIRIMTPDFGSPITVLDWAYNSDVDEGIVTGFVESAFDNDDIYYGLSATIELNFNEPVSNLALEDFEITGGMVSGLSALTPGEVYELDISGNEEGIIDIQLPTGAVDSEGKVVLGAHTQFTMITSVGLENTLESSVNIFPNPAHQEVTINMEGEADLSILNALGQKILHFDQFRGDRIDISHLPQGSYTAVFRTDQESFTRKFIKQ